MESKHMFDGSQAAFGIFRKKSEVTAAKAALSEKGFSRRDISILYPPHAGAKDFSSCQKSTVLTGAIIGAANGGVFFLIIGFLISMRAIPLLDLQDAASVPSSFFFIFSGFVGGAIFGGAAGALIGIGTPQRAKLRYGDYVDAGGILMSVHADSPEKASEAQRTLEKSGAQDINVVTEGSSWETIYGNVFRPA
jgi:hypothetical protein